MEPKLVEDQILDKLGNKYQISGYYSYNEHDRFVLDIGIYEKRQIAHFQFRADTGDEYTLVDESQVSEDYRRRGLYTAMLDWAKKFVKTLGFKGVWSSGRTRSVYANKFWDSMKNKRTEVGKIHYNEKEHNNYFLEHIRSFGSFLNEDFNGKFNLPGLGEIEIDTEMKDYHSGQSYLSTYATLNDKTIGRVDWSEYNKEIYIDFVEVKDPYKRKGIATKMFDVIKDTNPNQKIHYGMTSELGTKFLAAYRK